MSADIYNEKAAARVIGVHPDTLRRWRRAGLINFYRSRTGRIHYALDDLLAFTRNQKIEAAPLPDRPAQSPEPVPPAKAA